MNDLAIIQQAGRDIDIQDFPRDSEEWREQVERFSEALPPEWVKKRDAGIDRFWARREQR